ncbi:uncharacterized protein MELLADRAFT_113696 [Melampsora larici-populina 98AG31]|uniref:Uncharacterized protein n=1 Tax=Melampsora larici-populina (strain 98AG31 / pathotype 3-4-7) TaxID=747676 RepID=F4SAS8_MELLP|nr:uncharacterized protein MELLADRAFT_113696 [Melampsora larici-populina 98AG31]EGF98216.1 hypothetical protein MELLADRAFT_113696 [Melampsora larici-populina 98AG31]
MGGCVLPSEPDTAEDASHKRPRIDFELLVSIGAGQPIQEARNLGDISHNDIHTVINFNSSSPAHATTTHSNCGNHKAHSILISIDHKTTCPSPEIMSLDQNSSSTAATATTSEPIPHTNKALESESYSLKRARVEVLDQKIEVTISPVPKRQKIDSANPPIIVGPPCAPSVGKHPNAPITPVYNHQHINSGDSMIGTPRTPYVFGPPDVRITPVHNHQDINSGDSMFGTPHTPIVFGPSNGPITPVHNHQDINSSDSIFRTPCTPNFFGQPDVPITPVHNHPTTDFLDDAMILDTPWTPVHVKHPKVHFESCLHSPTTPLTSAQSM